MKYNKLKLLLFEDIDEELVRNFSELVISSANIHETDSVLKLYQNYSKKDEYKDIAKLLERQMLAAIAWAKINKRKPDKLEYGRIASKVADVLEKERLNESNIKDLDKKIANLRQTDVLINRYLNLVHVGSTNHDDAMGYVRNYIQFTEDGNTSYVNLARSIIINALTWAVKHKRSPDKKQLNQIANDTVKEWKLKNEI